MLLFCFCCFSLSPFTDCPRLSRDYVILLLLPFESATSFFSCCNFSNVGVEYARLSLSDIWWFLVDVNICNRQKKVVFLLSSAKTGKKKKFNLIRKFRSFKKLKFFFLGSECVILIQNTICFCFVLVFLSTIWS